MKEIKKLNAILKDWTSTEDILIALNKQGIHMDARGWRRFVNQYNKSFGERSTCIVGGKKGYKLTRNANAIARRQYAIIRNCVSGIKNAKKILDELGKSNQLTLLNKVNLYFDDLLEEIE